MAVEGIAAAVELIDQVVGHLADGIHAQRTGFGRQQDAGRDSRQKAEPETRGRTGADEADGAGGAYGRTESGAEQKAGRKLLRARNQTGLPQQGGAVAGHRKSPATL